MVSEWIAVSDRLPTSTGNYLIYHVRKGVNLTWYSPKNPAHFFGMEITHWMPLPKPPVAESAAIPPAPPYDETKKHPEGFGKGPLVQDHGPRVDTRSDLGLERCPSCGSDHPAMRWCSAYPKHAKTPHSYIAHECIRCNDPFHAAASQEAGSAAPKKEERR